MNFQYGIVFFAHLAGFLAACVGLAFAVESTPIRTRFTPEERLGVKVQEISIEISEWRHWTSKARPKAQIETELRREFREYVFVTADERARLERTNSLLGYSGQGKFRLPNGVAVPWKQMSSLFSIQIPSEISNGRSFWLDFAPLPWVKQLEKENGMPNKALVPTLAKKRDAIDSLVDELNAQPLWVNGESPILKLPPSAKPEEVVAACLTSVGFDNGHIKKHEVIRIRSVLISTGYPPEYSAALVDSDLGKKIVLFRWERTMWWSRVFDVK